MKDQHQTEKEGGCTGGEHERKKRKHKQKSIADVVQDNILRQRTTTGLNKLAIVSGSRHERYCEGGDLSSLRTIFLEKYCILLLFKTTRKGSHKTKCSIFMH